MYPASDDAICICDKGFNNATIANNPHCRTVDCNIPLHYADKLREGCAPVYYGKATGCPIEWICRKSIINDLFMLVADLWNFYALFFHFRIS